LLLAADAAKSQSLQPFYRDAGADRGNAGRASPVTHIAQQLRCDKIINYRRGSIIIIDRVRLKRRACDCYAEIDRNLTNHLNDSHDFIFPLERKFLEWKLCNLTDKIFYGFKLSY
jgi:hypothetical protein